MWIFYLCLSGNKRQTYTGITTNPIRRLRQHRGEIKGGARWPLAWKSGCDYALQVKGFPTPKLCRSFEMHTKTRWRTRWDLNRKFTQWCKEKNIPTSSSATLRILTVLHLLTLPKFEDLSLEVLWHPSSEEIKKNIDEYLSKKDA
jgi:hypothetical protein